MKFTILTKALIVILFSLISVSCSKEKTQKDPPRSFDPSLTSEENIDVFINQRISSGLTPGIAVAVIKDNEVIIRKNYGFANIESEIPVTSDSPFNLASVSKQFTAMLIMILEERGLLSYESELATFLPEVPETWRSITVHQLLTHQSGIPNYGNIPGIEILTNSAVFNNLIENENLDFTPGEKYLYSGSGYIVLSLIIEKISGQSYSTFITENIFDPLRMSKSAVYVEPLPAMPNRAIGYAIQPDGTAKVKDWDKHTSGSNGIYSTINDLIKWDQALNSESLVSKETLEKAYGLYVQISDYPDGYYYGYGWAIHAAKDDPGVFVYQHTGGYHGIATMITRIPTKGLTVITLSNAYSWAIDLNYRIVEYHYLQ